MASLRKLFSVTLSYSLMVKDSNRDLPTVASNHSGATYASEDSIPYLPTVASNHSGATCEKRFELRTIQSDERPFLAKMLVITKLFLQIFLHLHRTRSRVALVLFSETISRHLTFIQTTLHSDHKRICINTKKVKIFDVTPFLRPGWPLAKSVWRDTVPTARLTVS